MIGVVGVAVTLPAAVLVVAVGLAGLALAASAAPRFRRPTTGARVLPYLGALGPRRSRLLAPSGTPSGVLAALVHPAVDMLAARLTHLFRDGEAALTERLAAAGADDSTSRFRAEQVTWGLVGVGGAMTLIMLLAATGRAPSVPLVVGLLVSGAAGGVAFRDRALSRAASDRRARAEREFPTFVDMVCIAVTAGESVRASLDLVASEGDGPLAVTVRSALRDARGGAPLADALAHRARTLGVAPFERFVDVVTASVERGLPPADALRALAFDRREEAKRELIEAAGRKQVSMLVPVVALILPVALVFAFYPGVVAIRTMAR